MNTKLHNRVEKLELRIGGQQEAEPLFIHIVFVDPGEVDRPHGEIQRIQSWSRGQTCREWLRSAGETEEAMKCRAVHDMRRDGESGHLVFRAFSE